MVDPRGWGYGSRFLESGGGTPGSYASILRANVFTAAARAAFTLAGLLLTDERFVPGAGPAANQ